MTREQDHEVAHNIGNSGIFMIFIIMIFTIELYNHILFCEEEVTLSEVHEILTFKCKLMVFQDSMDIMEKLVLMDFDSFMHLQLIS